MDDKDQNSFLAIRTISKSFGGVRALMRLSLKVRQGSITGIIGPNGAGKTTLFDVVSGYTRPDEGAISMGKIELTSFPPHKVAQLGVYRTFQDVRIFNHLTVLDNLLMANTRLYGDDPMSALFRFTRKSPRWTRTIQSCVKSLEIVGLESRIHSQAATLSYGQKKLLMLACAFQSNAKLLLLDEPTSGVQHSTVLQIINVLRLLVADKAKTVLLIEHDMHVVQEVSDWVVLLSAGEKVLEGPPNVVFNDPQSRRVFLE